MYDFKLLGEISKGTSEISNKILNPYTARFSIFLCDLRYLKIVTS